MMVSILNQTKKGNALKLQIDLFEKEKERNESFKTTQNKPNKASETEKKCFMLKRNKKGFQQK